ncbi:hypothetical protein EYF80_054437 [Liparis tanakae]|uniref:Uncharacterized protein n=1 Tax=Liparis tanakae TaxID=230148 RepID=A0A4Z2F3Q9_9TELE|nr:hypothetical protein EYF80_054437 [Liparis tanakae]
MTITEKIKRQRLNHVKSSEISIAAIPKQSSHTHPTLTVLILTPRSLLRPRMQRTERLQKEMTITEKIKKPKWNHVKSNEISRKDSTKQSSQTHPTLTVLILTPRSLLRPR